jgi:hypothetical protein
MVSTSDLVSWRYEPSADYGTVSVGIPAADGSLFLLLGSGSSYRQPLGRRLRSNHLQVDARARRRIRGGALAAAAVAAS